MPEDVKILLTKLVHTLCAFDFVSGIYLFGSRAREDAVPRMLKNGSLVQARE
jgi:hypothetical protein